MSTNHSSFKVTLIPTTTTIHQLPDLALLQVLHHVPTGRLVHVARLVCQRWNSLYREVLATRKQRLTLVIGNPLEGKAPTFFYKDNQFLFGSIISRNQNPREALVRLDRFPLKKTHLTQMATFFPRITSLVLVNTLGPATIVTLSVFADMIEAVLEAKREYSSKFQSNKRLETEKWKQLTHLKLMLGDAFDPWHWLNRDRDWYRDWTCQAAISTLVPPRSFDGLRVFLERGQALFQFISSPQVCPALHHLEIWYGGPLWSEPTGLGWMGVYSHRELILFTLVHLRQLLARGQALRELHLHTGDLSSELITVEVDRNESSKTSSHLKLRIRKVRTRTRPH